MSRVGLVIVSHSEKIAHGVVELAGQMAGNTTLVAAAGTDEGGLGTSFEKISAAIRKADDGAGVVVFCDLGSAILTAETALDFLDDEPRSRVRIADAPIVEGAVAAAVAAETGADLAAVLAAGESAGGPPLAPRPVAVDPAMHVASARVTLTNPSGLHARPAADLVKLASHYQSAVTVNGVDAASLLAMLSLGVRQGGEVEIEARGPDAQAAVDGLLALIRGGFGE